MKSILKCIMMLALMGFFGSCANEAAVIQDSTTTAVRIDKTPEMVAFERSLTSAGKDLTTAKAVTDKNNERFEGARNYLAFYNQDIAKGATDNEILRQALQLHSRNVKELINQSTTVK